MHLEALGIHVALWISLVTLGGCHHLDGWSSAGGLARVGDCSWPSPVIVRGVVSSPAECRKVTLVNCSSLSYLTCGSVLAVSFHVDEVCETPLSRRTTKCWSTQRGRSALASTLTSGENRLSLAIWHSLGD